MTITYANFTQFTAVYSVRDITPAAITDTWLPHGALRVNEALGGAFTTPFGSDNFTARDLSIHYAYLGILMRTRKQDDSTELREYLETRVTDIRSANMPMVLEDGTQLFSDGSGGQVWSNNQDFKPIFDHRESEFQRIDPDLLRANEDADSR